MSVRMHITRAKTGSRRAHDALTGPRLSKDSASGAVHMRHRADVVSGTYRGKTIPGLLRAAGGKAVATPRAKKKASKKASAKSAKAE
jgi:large subunit ribosomal protein L32